IFPISSLALESYQLHLKSIRTIHRRFQSHGRHDYSTGWPYGHIAARWQSVDRWGVPPRAPLPKPTTPLPARSHTFTDLMNRALDKPAEQVKHTGEDSGPVKVIYSWRATNEHENDDESV